jgi:hypothetical protein
MPSKRRLGRISDGGRAPGGRWGRASTAADPLPKPNFGPEKRDAGPGGYAPAACERRSGLGWHWGPANFSLVIQRRSIPAGDAGPGSRGSWGGDLLSSAPPPLGPPGSTRPHTTTPTVSSDRVTARSGEVRGLGPHLNRLRRRGRTRGLLRRVNSKVQAALRDLEAAQDALDDIYERGPIATRAGYLALARKLR